MHGVLDENKMSNTVNVTSCLMTQFMVRVLISLILKQIRRMDPMNLLMMIFETETLHTHNLNVLCVVSYILVFVCLINEPMLPWRGTVIVILILIVLITF